MGDPSPLAREAEFVFTPAVPVPTDGAAFGAAPESIDPLNNAFPGSALATGPPGVFGSASDALGAPTGFATPLFGSPANDSGAATESSGGAAGGALGPPDAATSAPVTADAGGGSPALDSTSSAAASESEAIRILGSASPSGAQAAYSLATTAASDEVAAARTDLAENPPTLEAPSGISPLSEGALDPVPIERAAPPVPTSGINSIAGEGSTPEPLDTAHDPATGPIPEAPSGATVVASAPEDPVARAQFFLQQIGFAPVSDENVDTSAGPRPLVALTEGANPGRLTTLEGEQAVPIDGAMSSARAGMCEDEGIDRIFPTLPDEVLSARFEIGATSIDPAEELERPNLSAEMEEAIDRGGSGNWASATDDFSARYDAGQTVRRTKETSARAVADAEIAGLTAEAVAEQRGHRIASGETVADARAGWRSEIEDARATYDGERGRIRTQMDGDIASAVCDAEQEADAHLADGERRAEAERVETERRAAEARATAEREAEESDGFFDWVASKVSSFIDGLKSLLHGLFDLLRSAVRIIINGVKALANAAIELGRRAVVGLIRVAGGLLELAADTFLIFFPEARNRAKAWIRDGVAAAEEGVNQAAGWLRDRVNEALDALGNALIAILDVVEAIYSAILDVVRFLIVGLVQVYRFLARLTIAAYHSPEHFESQIYEEMLGADLNQPLPFELTEAEAAQLASGEDAALGDFGDLAEVADGGPAGVMSAPRLAEGDIVMDEVVPFEASPEFYRTVQLGDGASVEFDGGSSGGFTVDDLRAEAMSEAVPVESTDADPAPPIADDGSAASAERPGSTEDQLQNLMNGDPEYSCDAATPTAETGPAIPLSAKIGPLTKSQRARYMLSQAWKGIRNWFACNWGKILAAVIIALLVVAAIVAAVVLSGGTVGALLAAAGAIATPLLTALTGAMILYAIGRALSYIGDYLSNAWHGRIGDSAKALARAGAIGAVELIFAILTYVTAGAFRVLAAGARATGRAVTTVARGAGGLAARGGRAVGTGLRTVGRAGGRVLRSAGRGVVRLTGRAGRVALVNGRLVIRNVRRGFARGVRNLRDLARRIAGRLRFRRFRIRRAGHWLILEGYVNPWVRIAQTREVDWVDESAVSSNSTRPGMPSQIGDTISGTTREGRVVSGEVISRSSRGPYRRELAHYAGDIEGDVAHHAFEQQTLNFAGDIVGRGEMHSVRNLRRITGGVFNFRVHLSRIRTLWDDFYQIFRTLPQTAANRAFRRQALEAYRRYVDDMIRFMNRYQRRAPAYRAALASGNEAEAARLLDEALNVWQSHNPPSAILQQIFGP